LPLLNDFSISQPFGNSHATSWPAVTFFDAGMAKPFIGLKVRWLSTVSYRIPNKARLNEKRNLYSVIHVVNNCISIEGV
jgi:hypothetical protein